MAHTIWYDFSGELFESADSTHFVLNYFASVKGILLFVDPTNSPKVVKELGLSDIDNAPDAEDHRDIGVIQQIESIVNKTRGEDALRDMYIAVIVNKIDLFKDRNFDYFGNFSSVWNPSPHNKSGGFVMDDYEITSREVIEYLQVYHPSLYGHLQVLTKRENLGYFGVSPLGHPLEDGEIVKDVEPIRVEDPFYWLLWKMGHLPKIE